MNNSCLWNNFEVLGVWSCLAGYSCLCCMDSRHLAEVLVAGGV